MYFCFCIASFLLYILFAHISFSLKLPLSVFSYCLGVPYIFFNPFFFIFFPIFCSCIAPLSFLFYSPIHLLLFFCTCCLLFLGSWFLHPALPFLCLSACRCRMCAATFFSKSDMQIHSKSHTEAKPHKCPHCAKSFANSSYLAQHIRIHSGAKPYTCSYCQKSFRQLSHLQQHTRYCRLPHPLPSSVISPCPLNQPCQVLFRSPD